MKETPYETLEESYLSGDLEKYEYIDQMHKLHKSLYYISRRLRKVDIKKIEIYDGQLIFSTKQDGIKLLFNGIDRRGAPYDILNFRSYEVEDEKMLFKLLDDGMTIFDVGANIGWYSLLFTSRLKNSIVHAFEPIKETYDVLKKNIDLNNAKNINALNIGLSDKIGNTLFYYFPEGSVLASQKNLIDCPKSQQTRCSLITLDRYVTDNKIKDVCFVKCDVEGAELQVIRGGMNTLKKHSPILFVELFDRWTKQFNYHPDEIIKELEKIGYACFFTHDSCLHRTEKYFEMENERLNFFFLHLDKHQSKIKEFKKY